MSYETIEADGQILRTSSVGNITDTLIDCTTGKGITLLVDSPATLRNIGFKGIYRGGGFAISITAPSGTVEMENIYMADGATKEGETFVHGPGGVFYHKRADCDVVFREMNVQGWTNNGFYCSNTASGGSVRWERCFGKNNGVSTFRCAGADDQIIDCVAYNDNTDYGPGYSTGWVESNGRPFWVWPGNGTVTIDDCEFAAGTYGHAGGTHGTGKAFMRGGAVDGTLVGNVETDNVGRNPSLEPPEGVPMSAEEAASGGEESGNGDGHWEQEHVYELLNTNGRAVKYYIEAESGANFTASTYNGADTRGVKWLSEEGDRVAGRLDPGDHHAWEFDTPLLNVHVSEPEHVDVRVDTQQSYLSRYPLEDASDPAWMDEINLGTDDGPEDNGPSYEELQEQNEQLREQVAELQERIDETEEVIEKADEQFFGRLRKVLRGER